MLLSAVTGRLYGLAKGLAKVYLHNETVDLALEMLLADSIPGAAEAFIGAASADGRALSMDFVVVLGALITLVALSSCLVRFLCWLCIGTLITASSIEKIHVRKKGHQIQSQREPAEHKRRRNKVEGKASVPAEQNLQQASEVLSKMHPKQESGAAKSGGKGKQGAAGKSKESAIAAPPQQQLLQQQEAEFTATSRRTPQDTRATPKSILRGFPEVDILLTSPGQSYLLIGCRSKRKTSLYPQSDAAAFMERGKELQERHFTDMNAVVTTAVGLEKKAEIYAAQFSMDDTRLVAGERFTDTFVCFLVSGRTNVCLTQLWSMKLPDHRLVSSVPRWSVLGQDSLLSIVDQTAEVEVITCGAAETSTAHKGKFKVGSALAWAVCDDRIALGGSFLREPRLSRVVQRAGGGGITLEPVVVLPNAAKLRVSALAFVAPGAPAFNTRSYMIVFLENGIGTIYGVQTPSTQNTPQVVSTFADTDYAGHRVDAPLCILTAVRGQAYHEVLRIALLRGPNVTVYEQSGKADGGNFQMVRVADLYDVQEGDTVKHATFLQSGLGLATSGHADGRHVRMFTLPSPGKAA
ncbi:conserved hypothetical protein [Leishmania major strain Friedlin]|uniref:Uncharacterized protein n=1 Tax=Leishmania major TaxID=5664 RepID=Q4Q8I0_LEIMA|nr:conserved hypothetical protein [Leishmania major strain Friedlin]CAG9577192.1 hypothetical_protein_-_conserved [Leishmania major strain Friedlin]CAJ05199.1 conserved hypothetical protein [Leishmania major strain Friedlin]|eukprot:XP_001684368.1 conserved hypothetical protein [Leishmania major strain Friedlin]